MNLEEASHYGTLAGVFLLALLAQWNAHKAKRTAGEAKVRSVEIHNLVNGGRLNDLSKLVDLTQRIFDITKDPRDAHAHESAVKDFESHKTKFNISTNNSTDI
jgi:hypothetical protein